MKHNNLFVDTVAHDFGLHGAALMAKDMSGSMTGRCDGTAKGATFALVLPFKPAGARLQDIERVGICDAMADRFEGVGVR